MLSFASHARRRVSFALTAVLSAAVAAGCAPQANKTENPASSRANGGGSGSGGSQPGSSTGSGGNSGSGGGGPGLPGAGGGSGASGGASGNSPDGGQPSQPAGPEIPLPMIVTSHFNNQGWFGDPSLSQAIAGGALIQQTDAVTGPCAMRAPGARGKCLKIVYAPPAGLLPPEKDAFVGVFFLTTILQPDPSATPPLKIGDANWGAQPGKNIAPGATKITFSAAATQEGLPVTFKAGVMTDSFVVAEQLETLGTAWKTATIPLNGQPYGSNVIGAFAWVLKDTTKPATFYLDNIVWE